jgi:cyclopropane-fatty-acyl-phospholipid synthase
MPSHTLPKDRSLSALFSHSRFLDRVCRQQLLKKLQGLQHGCIVLNDLTGEAPEALEIGDTSAPLRTTLVIRRSSFYSRTVLGGSIGTAESYVDEDWDCDDLTSLVRIMVLNRDQHMKVDTGIGALLTPLQKFFHGLRANTLEGSRENIRAHYDMGNDFFELFLDESMMYSSAIFPTREASLAEAQEHKLKTICERLDLRADMHLLEIGSGWGALAIYAARHYGCRVTTTTISSEQYRRAVERVRSAGLEDKVTVLFEDYRNLRGLYDRLVSVEMIEAVGLENLPTYFSKCSTLLKPDGLMVLQAITIREQFYEYARNSVDFIQRHIFPGGGLPSVKAMMDAVASVTDFFLIEQRDFADDYAETLARWAQALEQHKAQLPLLGYPEYLYRLWRFYFAYCEGGFRERSIGVSHLTFGKRLYR